ncbi:zeta toxin family protein [Neisseria dentiae]|uniref:zeta toxin family protein n=1 Tax=Neisseria dentiae TaxID=194197 RepID=UPI00359FB7C1
MRPKQAKAVFYCGTNGAGKTTLRGLNHDAVSVVIDSDHIAAELNPANPRAADMEAGRQALKLFQTALNNGISFSMESTLSGVSVLRRMQQAKDKGFHVILNYIGLVSADLHIERVQSRIRSGGHPIDSRVIRKRFIESHANLAVAVQLADEAYLYDNSGAELALVLYAAGGKIYLQTDTQPAWVQKLIQTLTAV